MKLLFIVLALLTAAALQAAETLTDPTPKELFKNLKSDKTEERSLAYAYIHAHKPAPLIPLLKSGILKKKEAGKRRIYLDTLKLYPFTDSLDTWIELLEETGSYPLKIEIMEHISSRGRMRRIVLPIAAELKSPFLEVRRNAAKILARIGDDRVYPVVLSMMRDRLPAVRVFAVDALNIHLYDDRFKEELVSMLKDTDGVVKVYAIRSIRNHSIDSALTDIRRIAESYGDSASRYEAITYLADKAPSVAVTVCAGTVNDRDRIIRLAAANSMCRINSPLSAGPVCARLKAESDSEVKDALMDFLIRSRRIPDAGGVKRILLNDAEEALRVKAAYVLGLTKDKSSVNALVKALADRERNVKAEACYSLGNFQSDAATNALVTMIDGREERYVRSAALFAVMKSKTRNATVRLFDIFASEKDLIFRSSLYKAVRELIVKYH